MNQQRQDYASMGGSRNRARGSGTDSWLGLFTEMMTLPFRMLGLGMQWMGGSGGGMQQWMGRSGEGMQEFMARSGEGMQQWMERSGEGVRRLAQETTGDWTSGGNRPAGGAPTSGSAGSTSAGAWDQPIPGTGTGSDDRPARPVTNPAETTNREEKDMACDKDLSGTDLKIIEYTIVSVDPNIQDDERRILQPMRTVATTEDMNENGFTAWVIAMYFQQPDHRRLGPDENWKQYLRVCYCVQCRVPIPEVDCCQQQANALRDINRTLNRLGGLPNAGAEGGQAGQVGQGGGAGGALTPTGRPGGRRGAQGTAAEGGEGGNV